jgi:hypothetical protein
MIDWDAQREKLIEQAKAMKQRWEQNRAKDGYPFCDTDRCPWWVGYCSRDPVCND